MIIQKLNINSRKYFQEKGDLVRSIDYETVTSFDPPFVAAIKDLWNDPGIQVTFPVNLFRIFNASFAGVLWQTEGVSVDRFGKIVSSLTFELLGALAIIWTRTTYWSVLCHRSISDPKWLTQCFDWHDLASTLNTRICFHCNLLAVVLPSLAFIVTLYWMKNYSNPPLPE